METNPQIELAFNFLQYTGTNIFLTGKAGTGKTTFLRHLKEVSPKRMIVLAPTGVAAINAGGMTLHSFFQLPFGPYITGTNRIVADTNSFTNKFSRDKINIMRSLDLLVIDEISMVRADLLDAVSDVLCRYRNRSKPFGGVQLLLIGDLQQLAPVVKDEEWSLLKDHYESAFFFHSKALRETTYTSIELTHVYRQSDTVFINLLNKVRDNQVDREVINELNKRYIPDFNPRDKEGYITLTTHNYQSQQLNARKMSCLETKPYSYKAKIEGNFPEFSYPTDETLILKKGAQVMFVKNDSSPEKRYYNGKIGRIILIDKEQIIVKCANEEDVKVSLEEWTNTKYSVNEETKEITETIEGKFIQYPLKTAWAITIHKSQGLTFERAIIDAATAFSHGQVYVALSRCKTLNGLILSTPLNRDAVICDEKVQSFTHYVEQHQPDTTQFREAKRRYFTELLIELFDYDSIQRRMQYVAHLFFEHLQKLYPDLAERYYRSRDNCRQSLTEVGERFKIQLQRLVAECDDYEQNAAVRERVIKGVHYFREQMEKIVVTLIEDTHIEIDNKEVRKSFEDTIDKLRMEAGVKIATLEAMTGGFDMKHYLEVKAKAMIEKTKPKSRKTTEKAEVSADIQNPVLYKTLIAWRKMEAERLKLPLYTIMQQKALIGISNLLPTGSKELLKIPGIGKKVLEKYGLKILEIVDEFRFQN